MRFFSSCSTSAKDQNTRVKTRARLYLNVYDLTRINNYLYWFGLGIFHSGIEVHGLEYGFGAHEYPSSGVFEVEPRSCPGFIFRRSVLLGTTDMSHSEFRSFMEHLSGKYHGDTYHLIAKNCNHFTDEVSMQLTGKPIPGWVNRLARLGSFCNCLLPESIRVTAIRHLPDHQAYSGCGDGAPDIKFPFHLQHRQPQHCGYTGFELVCKQNITTIQFPSYGELHVLSIKYDIRKLNLLDPKNCVHEVFLNLNLSLTPFQYYYTVKNYTYLNCSAMLSPPMMQVPCLSDSAHHVYVIESPSGIPDSCRVVKTVAIPFSYSPYISDNIFGLGFTWDSTVLSQLHSETEDQTDCINMDNCEVLGITILIFIIAICIKTYHSENKHEEIDKETEYEFDLEKLIGDPENIKPERLSNTADTKVVNSVPS